MNQEDFTKAWNELAEAEGDELGYVDSQEEVEAITKRFSALKAELSILRSETEAREYSEQKVRA